MSAIIDDDLVRSVAVAITGAPYPTARSLAKARAALAVAVPVITARVEERLRQEADDGYRLLGITPPSRSLVTP